MLPARLPAGPGPGEERQPTAEELAIIQWTFGITDEAEYGPETQGAVRQVQENASIPVDPDVLVGPRTWWHLAQAYLKRLRDAAPPAGDLSAPGILSAPASDAASTPTGGALSWEIPAEPYQLTGGSEPEQHLAGYIARLNTELIPDAAQYYVRNKQICQLKAAGTPPAARVAVPPLSDPEVQECIARLTWDQEKVNRLWAKANAIGLDPRIMLAVLCQEGTGSFDTNAEIPAQFWGDSGYFAGGSGVQPDFELDLAHAMEQHILAKVRAYGWYGPLFRSAAEENGLGDGNVFEYVNYNVPWVKDDAWDPTPGCYATDTQWWAGLKSYFDRLAFPGATHAYSLYLELHPLAVGSAPAPVRFVVTNNGTGEVETITGQPWIEARPL